MNTINHDVIHGGLAPSAIQTFKSFLADIFQNFQFLFQDQ